MIVKQITYFLSLFIFLLFSAVNQLKATDISDNTFLITNISSQNYNNKRLLDVLSSNDYAGVEMKIKALNNNVFLNQSSIQFSSILNTIHSTIQDNQSKILPVFLEYDGNILLLDSIINDSELSRSIFYLPQGEAWPSIEYLVQANRRVIFFVRGKYENESRILHRLDNYALQVSADKTAASSFHVSNPTNINLELFLIDNFEKLQTSAPPNRYNRNLIPDYINFLLESWKKYGKRPNFIFVGRDIFNFDFIVDQLNSFTWIKGRIRTSGKNLEKVYWKNTDILITGGNFCFPYRGGEELILSPYAPGYKMSPEQMVITSEMTIPDSYSILANPLKLNEKLTASFGFEGILLNAKNNVQDFEGSNFSFIQDIERGNVLRLPENASINLGDPEIYGLRNNSFTVSCFVKFTEILEFGDNAILGNFETGYRRGLHLVLRSGHPYFGLWANDFMSEEKLQSNVWYHLVWRYIVETGEQSIFVNGKFIGGSDGHPPFDGTGDIHLGSALSSGASLRGYIDNLYTWNRPLGNEEINRLSLDEEIDLFEEEQTNSRSNFSAPWWILFVLGTIVIGFVIVFTIRYWRRKKPVHNYDLPITAIENQIQLFGEFKAINSKGENVTELFTPKVKELFLFALIYTQKDSIGPNNSALNEILWPGIQSKKVANNRSVTLNKLRKILIQFNGIEIVSNTGHVQTNLEKPFVCDFAEAFKLCRIPQGMSRNQLMNFFQLVKRGRFLKGLTWPWLDEIRGFTGNQVIDNLLKLAVIYKKESKLKEVEKVAQRILDYDDLNEEAIFLQIWALQKANNSHLSKFHFNSFCSKYEKNIGEPFTMNFREFNNFYSDKL